MSVITWHTRSRDSNSGLELAVELELNSLLELAVELELRTRLSSSPESRVRVPSSSSTTSPEFECVTWSLTSSGWYYKVRQLSYYKVRQAFLQSATLLQSVTVLTRDKRWQINWRGGGGTKRRRCSHRKATERPARQLTHRDEGRQLTHSDEARTDVSGTLYQRLPDVCIRECVQYRVNGRVYWQYEDGDDHVSCLSWIVEIPGQRENPDHNHRHPAAEVGEDDKHHLPRHRCVLIHLRRADTLWRSFHCHEYHNVGQEDEDERQQVQGEKEAHGILPASWFVLG